MYTYVCICIYIYLFIYCAILSLWYFIATIDITKTRLATYINVSVYIYINTWWLIRLSKWVITPFLNGISRLNPLLIGVITHLQSGMSHQVHIYVHIPYLIKPCEHIPSFDDAAGRCLFHACRRVAGDSPCGNAKAIVDPVLSWDFPSWWLVLMTIIGI